MKALIDGDILVYRVGYTTMEEGVGIAEARMETLIDNILEDSGCMEYQVFLTSTDKSNFRFKLYPEYKANRKQPKPTWYEELRAMLVSDHKAKVIYGMEADDALGIAQTGDTIICSIDKDLDQIPGQHYNFVKESHYEVSQEEAEEFFFFQLLVGDRTDNIPGCAGIGPVHAGRIISRCDGTVASYEKACLEAYQKAYGVANGMTNLLLYGRLLKIKQHEEEGLWQPETLGELKLEESAADSKP
jgi:5'-3' exonuclease